MTFKRKALFIVLARTLALSAADAIQRAAFGIAETTEIIVTQSSDSSFHCIAFTVFYRSKD